MDDWFTIENIDKQTFVISEYKHWEKIHCYLVIGSDRAVLIDTGLGISNIRNVVDRLTTLPVLVITTHVHWDHIGGHNFFSDIAVHKAETKWISNKFPLSLPVVKSNLLKESCDFPRNFDIEKYRIFQGKPTKILEDGNLINLGNRELSVLHTPGHSPGHICLYEIEREYLFSGDLIYMGCLDAFYPSTNPVDFMKSVNKISSLNIRKVFPAHYSLDIPVKLVNEVDKAFKEIHSQGHLKQGSGFFKYKDFSIHI